MTSLFPWIREEDFVNDVTIYSSALAQDDVEIEVDALAIAFVVRRHSLFKLIIYLYITASLIPVN